MIDVEETCTCRLPFEADQVCRDGFKLSARLRQGGPTQHRLGARRGFKVGRMRSAGDNIPAMQQLARSADDDSHDTHDTHDTNDTPNIAPTTRPRPPSTRPPAVWSPMSGSRAPATLPGGPRHDRRHVGQHGRVQLGGSRRV